MTPTTPSSTALNVVLIDDHTDSREMAAEFMRMSGFDVLEFASAEDALESIASSVPDAIVTDIILPGIDGREVAVRLRADARTRHLPLIAVTGRTDAMESALFDSVLLKPISVPALVDAVKRLAKERVPADEPEGTRSLA